MSDEFLNNLFQQTLETKPVTQTVTVTVEKTQQTDQGTVKEVKEIKNETQQTEHKLMEKQTPFLALEMGATINLGNFSNGRIKVGIHLPVGTEFTPALNSLLEQTFNSARKWVEKKMEHEVEELSKLRGKL